MTKGRKCEKRVGLIAGIPATIPHFSPAATVGKIAVKPFGQTAVITPSSGDTPRN